MQITKSTSSNTVPVGEIFDYTILVSNNTSTPASNVVVTDTLPTGSQFIFASSTKGTFISLGSIIICNIGILNPGESTIITITVKALQSGTLSNTAVVSADNISSITSNVATKNIATGAYPVFIINKETPANSVSVGQMFGYTIRVYNNSTTPATNAVIIDHLPPNTQFVSGSSNGGTFSQSGNMLTCTIPTLNPGQEVDIYANVIPLSSGLLINIATITSDNMFSSKSAVNNYYVLNPLTINKNASSSLIAIGDTLQYTINVTNNSANQVTNVVVTDSLPANSQFISACTTKGTCSNLGGNVTCTLGTLNANERETVTILANATNSGTLINSATLTSNEIAPIVSNTVVTTVSSISLPKISICKAVSCYKIFVGDTLKYKITVKNNSNTTATNVVVTDNLPSYVQLLSTSTTQGFFNSIGNKIICNLGSLNPYGEVTITIVLKVTNIGLISNVALVSADIISPIQSNSVSTSVVSQDNYNSCNKCSSCSNCNYYKSSCNCNNTQSNYNDRYIHYDQYDYYSRYGYSGQSSYNNSYNCNGHSSCKNH